MYIVVSADDVDAASVNVSIDSYMSDELDIPFVRLAVDRRLMALLFTYGLTS